MATPPRRPPQPPTFSDDLDPAIKAAFTQQSEYLAEMYDSLLRLIREQNRDTRNQLQEVHNTVNTLVIVTADFSERLDTHEAEEAPPQNLPVTLAPAAVPIPTLAPAPTPAPAPIAPRRRPLRREQNVIGEPNADGTITWRGADGRRVYPHFPSAGMYPPPPAPTAHNLPTPNNTPAPAAQPALSIPAVVALTGVDPAPLTPAATASPVASPAPESAEHSSPPPSSPTVGVARRKRAREEEESEPVASGSVPPADADADDNADERPTRRRRPNPPSPSPEPVSRASRRLAGKNARQAKK